MRRFTLKVKRSAKKKRDKAARHFSYRKTLVLALSSAIAMAIAVSFYGLYIKSQYFRVKSVVIIDRGAGSTVNYSDLERLTVGKNIFRLNLNDIMTYMLGNYRELRSLRLQRAFPDSIIATAVLRKPVAQLFYERYYPIDEDSVILSGVKDSPDIKLPAINGVRVNPSEDIGKATGSTNAKMALLLLKELNASGLLESHRLIEIDASSTRNLSFFLEDGMEIKIGRENYASRLQSLKEVLSDPKLRPADIKYIDLRFAEPVIAPKWKR